MEKGFSAFQIKYIIYLYTMDFKSIGKNKVGGAALLLLVVLLSQSNFFDFLFDSALGRAVLILLVIVTSYTNKILGVVSVLMIIIMFNSGSFGILEGLEQMNSDDKKVDDKKKTDDMKKKKDVNDVVDVETTNQDETIDELKKELSTIMAAQATTPEEKPAGVEGFDVLGTERALQKGKPSNCLNVNNKDKSCDSVLPVEGGSMFSSVYSAFNGKW
jgi:hypothetical protein